MRPSRWPVRRRIAAVTALLTAVILVGFAALVGRLTENRLSNDFRDELATTANQIGYTLQLDPLGAGNLGQMSTAGDVKVRIVSADGGVYRNAATPGFPDLGPPTIGVERVGEYQVATSRVFGTMGSTRIEPLYVQAARDRADLEQTIGRLWLFLGGGVAIGTFLSFFAGLMVAGRAMRPVTALTSAARGIASTRDPSRRIPEPEADDEVAELARTLDQMLRELDAARTETEATMQRQREFVADASHELRTPLTSVLANLELLQAGLGADGEDAEAIGSALRSSQRMSRLVGDLLLLARADAGKAGARRPVELHRVLEDVAAEAEPLATEHTIDLRCDDEVIVSGNSDELHRMLSNLIQNALQHTPPGTTVTATLERTGDEVVISVSDDGPGLPPGLESQVFDRFTRGSGPADGAGARGGGTGLGLSIVRAVAESHGGAVSAGASSTGGARFEIRLPLLVAGASRPPQQSIGNS